tara:strand:- start:2855 stop:3031 length:177 start_codon:yes stop_codon:yes gene_type:complete
MTRQEIEEKILYLDKKVKELESKMHTEVINGMPIVGTKAMLEHFKAMLEEEKEGDKHD